MESGLRAVEKILFAEDLEVAVAQETVKNDRPLWHTLAILAFALLLVEWWFFHRRPTEAAA